MRTWLEYRGEYSVTGDKVYVDRVEVEAPLHIFPFYELMEMPQETWLVYGPAIRAFLYEDWGSGGHHYIYPFVRPGELWLDSGIPEEGRAPVWMRYVIGWWLMKEKGLNFLEADTVGRAYATDFRVEQIRAGKIQLKSFYPKKNNQVLRYMPLTPEKAGKDQKTRNWEWEDVQMTKKGIQAKMKTDTPYWEKILVNLDKVSQDLVQASR